MKAPAPWIVTAMSVQPKKHYTLDEYLELERTVREKHEFFRGEIFAMGGASEAHNLIVSNVLGEMRQYLRGKPCRVYPSDMRVKVSASGLYTYPDVVVVCGQPQFEPPADTLLNPTLLVEVLSESSEAYDRGKKSEQYRTLASLTDYLLIAQDRALVEHYCRQPEERWLLQTANRLEESVAISSLGCELPLSEVYLNVTGISTEAAGNR
ncbi:MAG: Uma2 family endonuclease [Burkholderiales bacterium]